MSNIIFARSHWPGPPKPEPEVSVTRAFVEDPFGMTVLFLILGVLCLAHGLACLRADLRDEPRPRFSL
jgi:hypothetical protein